MNPCLKLTEMVLFTVHGTVHELELRSGFLVDHLLEGLLAVGEFDLNLAIVSARDYCLSKLALS